mmetsp:Transcript_165299/g.530579  ORF Transcript_165299/g.530579 Transcript_165299/m.530579 type:complete len:233 (-) Transcript_165299:378-1076(-)
MERVGTCPPRETALRAQVPEVGMQAQQHRWPAKHAEALLPLGCIGGAGRHSGPQQVPGSWSRFQHLHYWRWCSPQSQQQQQQQRLSQLLSLPHCEVARMRSLGGTAVHIHYPPSATLKKAKIAGWQGLRFPWLAVRQPRADAPAEGTATASAAGCAGPEAGWQLPTASANVEVRLRRTHRRMPVGAVGAQGQLQSKQIANSTVGSPGCRDPPLEIATVRRCPSRLALGRAKG